MFRRLDSALPRDPVYPTDLRGLGYFINDKDEIRSIKDPKAYFKFFLTKNDRYNCVQRESMNEAIRNIICDRLIDLGLCKIRLPLYAKETDPNLPIFVSSDLKAKNRVIILFYEHSQDLGVFAHRIIGSKGGINVGSAVNFVKYVQSNCGETKGDSPGVILANMGQLRWWRGGKKAVTQTSWYALPQQSAVDLPYRFDAEKNTIPGNRTLLEHVSYIFNHVVEELAHPAAKLDIVGVSEGAVKTMEFLENAETWKKWGHRIDAFAAIATFYQASEIKNKDFADWFQNRGRAYLTSQEPCGTFLAGPEGAKRIDPYGCPVFSLGEPYYSEMMLPKGYKTVLDWFQDVASDADYVNPIFKRFDLEDDDDVADEPLEGGIEITEIEDIE